MSKSIDDAITTPQATGSRAASTLGRNHTSEITHASRASLWYAANDT